MAAIRTKLQGLALPSLTSALWSALLALSIILGAAGATFSAATYGDAQLKIHHDSGALHTGIPERDANFRAASDPRRTTGLKTSGDGFDQPSGELAVALAGLPPRAILYLSPGNRLSYSAKYLRAYDAQAPPLSV
ncbi:MAG: hypothetical protein RLN70_05140 [Rhodospirillaceae bacterium]